MALFAWQGIDARYRNHSAGAGTQQETSPADFITKLLPLRDQTPSRIIKNDKFAV